jgi:hypothetical protein
MVASIYAKQPMSSYFCIYLCASGEAGVQISFAARSSPAEKRRHVEMSISLASSKAIYQAVPIVTPASEDRKGS